MVKEISDELARHIVNGGFLHCKDFHDNTCEYDAIVKFFTVYKMSVLFYVPVHLVPVVLFKYKMLLKKPKEVIFKYIKDVLRSTLFVSVYIAGFKYLCKLICSLKVSYFVVCLYKNTTGRFDTKGIALASFLSGLFLFIEAPWRRSEIVLFFLSRLLPSFWNFLTKWKYVKSIPYGEVLILAIGMSVIMYSYQKDPNRMKQSYYNMFNFFLGEN